MAVEPNLTSAAENAYKNLYVHVTGSNFAPLLQAFAATSLLQFNDPSNTDYHPAANWCAILEAYASGLPQVSTQMTPVQLRQAVEYVYRFCLLVDYLQSINLISGAQSAAVLAAYNANF